MSDGRKDPAMLFYGSDFYDDEAVRLMSLEQEAIYLRLLWHAWREGSIPADPTEIAVILRIPIRRFLKLWPRLERKWTPSDEPGRLVNRRQEHERHARAERTRKLSDAGVAGNARRWGVRSGGDRSTCDRDAIPSSTSTKVQRESAPADADAAPVPEAAPKPKPEGRRTAERPADVEPDLWREFLAIRSAKRKPLTPRAWSAIAKRIAAAGVSTSSALTTAVERGWADWDASWGAGTSRFTKPAEPPRNQPLSALSAIVHHDPDDAACRCEKCEIQRRRASGYGERVVVQAPRRGA